MPIHVGQDSAKIRREITAGGKTLAYYSIPAAQEAGLGDFANLPAALKVVLENMLRFEDGKTVSVDDIKAFSDWGKQGGKNPREIAYRPARVLMQDFTGVPAVVDLAAMRDATAGLGGATSKINPQVPVDLQDDRLWITVPAGEYVRGNDRLALQFENDVRLSRFPVTNSQFAVFDHPTIIRRTAVVPDDFQHVCFRSELAGQRRSGGPDAGEIDGGPARPQLRRDDDLRRMHPLPRERVAGT